MARTAAAVGLLAGLLLLWPVTRDRAPGRPGDASVLEGVGEPARLQGQPGRWTRGAGRIRLPRTALPVSVTIRVQAPDARLPDRLDIAFSGRPVRTVTLARGWQTIHLDLPPPGASGVLSLQSATTPDEEGRSLGVFLSAVTIVEGGPGSWRRTPLPTILCGVLLVAGLASLAWALLARGPDPAMAVTAALVWAVAALLLFRSPGSVWWLPMAGAAWAAAGLAAWLPRAVPNGLPRRAAGAAFLVGSVAIVGLLFVEAVTEGAVLGQAHMLDPYYPWRAYLPDGATGDGVPRPSPPFGDVPMLVYPFLAFTRERLLDGAFPLWTAAVNAGQPFFATYQAAVLSPLTWVALVVPLPQATVAIAMLRLLVGGMGMFVFIRGLGLSTAAATLAGLAYLLNPFSLVWLEHPPGGVPPWLPWMLHAAGRCGRGLPYGPTALAITTALVILGGHPHTGLFSAAFAGAFGAATSLAGERRWTRLGVVCAALGLGALAASVQILPFLEYLSLSRGAQWRNVYALNPFHAPAIASIAALVPNLFGDHHTGNYAGPLNYLEQVMYAGMPVLVLAMVALVTPRLDWRIPFFGVSALLAALIVYGAPGVNHLLSQLPLVKAATLTRMPIVAITATIVLAAFGIERVLAARDASERRTPALVAGAATGLVIVLVLWALSAHRSLLLRHALSAYAWHWSAWAGLLAIATSLAIVGCWRGAIDARRTAIVIGVLVVLDLFVFGRGFHGMLPPERVYPLLPEIARLRAEPGPFRVLGVKGALMPNTAMVYGLQDVRAYDGLGVAWYADLLDLPLVFVQAHQMHEAHAVDSRILDLLDVQYLVAPPDFVVPETRYARVPGTRAPLYRSRHALPRAFLVDGYRVLTGNDARRALRDGLVDVRRQAILEHDPPQASRPEEAPAGETPGEARVVAYAHERVVIETRASGARLLVVTDTFFPGWQARVDGRPVEIARANFAFRAVPVPAGSHRVELEYAPASFRHGLVLSGAALLAIGLWTLFDRRRRRRAPSAAGPVD